jgi:hypothetical protein
MTEQNYTDPGQNQPPTTLSVTDLRAQLSAAEFLLSSLHSQVLELQARIYALEHPEA